MANVNPLGRTITVQASLQAVSGYVSVVAPKTKVGKRVVVVPAFLADLLREQIADKLPGAFAFPAPDGGPLRSENWRKRVWAPAVAAGLDGLRPHDLRHSCATMLADEGVPWNEIARTVGRSRASFTLDRYSHPLPEQATAAASALDNRRAKVVDLGPRLVRKRAPGDA